MAGSQQRRAPLDRERVIRAAIALIDADGVHALTMRRLGQQLGVEAMSLYAHVHSRAQLLDGVVAMLVDEVYVDPEVQRRESDSWQDYLVRLAHGVRRSALAHPQAFPLIASQPPEAPWIRPPLRSLAWVNSFLESLHDYGFDDDTSVYAYRAFTSFLLGHLLLEVAARGAQVGPEPLPSVDPGENDAGSDSRPDPLALSDYPRLKQLSSRLAEDHSELEFDESLEGLLERLAAAVRHGVPD